MATAFVLLGFTIKQPPSATVCYAAPQKGNIQRRIFKSVLVWPNFGSDSGGPTAIFSLFSNHHFYSPAQPVNKLFTVRDLLDKPWSQFSSLFSRGSMPSFLQRIGLSIFPFLRSSIFIELKCSRSTATYQVQRVVQRLGVVSQVVRGTDNHHYVVVINHDQNLGQIWLLQLSQRPRDRHQ